MKPSCKDKIKLARDLVRDTIEEVEVNILLIRNELRKQKLDKSKIISYLVKIEEAIE